MRFLELILVLISSSKCYHQQNTLPPSYHVQNVIHLELFLYSMFLYHYLLHIISIYIFITMHNLYLMLILISGVSRSPLADGNGDQITEIIEHNSLGATVAQ